MKIMILPEDAPRTAMGIVADTFRQRGDVITGAGVIRTSGWGLHADKAAKSGMDYAIRNGGKALLLGVDIYKLTAMPCNLKKSTIYLHPQKRSIISIRLMNG